MSGSDSFTINISGNSNDSNLIISSTSGSIAENGSVGPAGPAGPAGASSEVKLTLQEKALLSELLPLENSHKSEETLSNIVTDALKDLTQVDAVVIASTNFKNANNSDVVSNYVKNTPLVKIHVSVENLKVLLENSHKSGNLFKISGLFCEFNVENHTLQSLYLKNKTLYSNVAIADHYDVYDADGLGYVGDKNTLLSVVLDKVTADTLQGNKVPVEFNLELTLKEALSSLILKLENSSPQNALLTKKRLPELINARQRIVGFGHSPSSGSPWLNTTGQLPCVKGTNGACSGFGVGSHTGVNIMSRGGNAADAIVASSFVNSIHASAFGFFGGAGFITVYNRETGVSSCIDCREALSQDVSADMVWPGTDASGVNGGAFSTMTIGVPGFMAGLYKLFKEHGSGKFTFAELIQPAVDILEINQELSPVLFQTFYPNGFLLNGDLVDTSKYANSLFSKDASGQFHADVKDMHHLQPEKLAFFKNVQKYGANYVYYGKEKLGVSENTFADEFVNRIQHQLTQGHIGDEAAIASSVVKLADMEMYEAKYRNPTVTDFSFNGSDYKLITHPSPCAGHCGSFYVKLAVMSGAVINNDMKHVGTLYRVAMVSHLAYKMRSYIAGDYDNWMNTPVLQNFVDDMSNNYGLVFNTSAILSNDDFYNMLVSDSTIAKFVGYLQAQPDWVSAASMVQPTLTSEDYTNTSLPEAGATNNFCAASEKLVVQFNNSINYLNGAKCCVMGMPINNEAYDFPDIGTRGTNDHGPSRRPASSQSPYILLKDGKAVYTVGGSGGWRIYLTCAWKLLCFINGLTAEETEATPVIMASFNRIIPTYAIPKKIKDVVVANNTNGFFVGAITTSQANCQSIEINNNNYTSVIGSETRNSGHVSAAVVKLA